ncbi:MAG: magnesium transporter MgtE N-terminal domain-containing protein, partial [Candidatus Zixiibacteriota bacterium]
MPTLAAATPEISAPITPTPLLPLAKSFLESDPIGAANCIEAMSEEEALIILKALPPSLAADVFSHLDVNTASALLEMFPSDLFNEIV